MSPAIGCSYHCKHIELAMVSLWKCDIINLSDFPVLPFHYCPLYNRGFTLLVHSGVCFTAVDNL